MAIDEHLAERVRTELAEVADVADTREQRMFGGLAFLVAGHMTCGIVGDRLMLRLGQAGADAALGEPHVSPMDFTGRPLTTMVFVEPPGTKSRAALQAWVRRAVEYVGTLPPKTGRKITRCGAP